MGGALSGALKKNGRGDGTVMELYTIGFTQKTAEQFFGLIRDNRIGLLADVRLNNASQLAGFTKGRDLAFFLREICGCAYAHCAELAPTKDILDDYKSGKIGWDAYADRFIPLIAKRRAAEKLMERYKDVERLCLLCSEPTPEHCHRRLVAEEIRKAHPEIKITHL